MSDIFKRLVDEDIAYSLLDKSRQQVLLLVSPDQKHKLCNILKRMGWKLQKNSRRRETFLYGMDPFKDFVYKGDAVTVCFQLACKSTMHGEWIPLDRKINNHALETRRLNAEDGLYYLEERHDLAWRLAKIIFTNRFFTPVDIEKIQNNEYLLNDKGLIGFIEGIFFKFTPILIGMVQKRDYERIIPACFSFSDY
ncbi:hypothetical protein FACS1894147_05780 [Spirochaetia bacterium]|nr:hypothetical protein FACS1894147_05780 [Spirochaetia bacterium]